MFKKSLLVSCIATLSMSAALANTTSNDVGRLAVMAKEGQVPAEATAAEAVAAASLGSSAVINNTSAYQQITDANRMRPKIFGEQLFRGAFSTTSGSTFNDSYIINPGDNVQVRMWGAYQYAATMTVDPQGNIFLPNVGPVRIAGIQNGQLQSVVQNAISRIYRSNVGVYALLEQAQPVKVFVTGFVNQPGYYGGLAVADYIAKSGGMDENVDPNNILVMQQNGETKVVNTAYRVQQGDEIMVLPKVKTRRIEIARGISQIFYQLAVAASAIVAL